MVSPNNVSYQPYHPYDQSLIRSYSPKCHFTFRHDFTLENPSREFPTEDGTAPEVPIIVHVERSEPHDEEFGHIALFKRVRIMVQVELFKSFSSVRHRLLARGCVSETFRVMESILEDQSALRIHLWRKFLI